MANAMVWSVSARIGATSSANQMRIDFLEARRPVDDRVNGHPSDHDEIPVTRILCDVDEALALERSLEHQRGQHQGIADIGDQIERMQAHQEPYRGSVGALVAAHVERRE